MGGNDIIYGGEGSDTINGGANSDTAAYTDSAESVYVSLETGKGYGGTAQGDTLISVENLTGSAQWDVLEGNAEANTLFGWDGHDSLKGGGGADTLLGGFGDDTLMGGAGGDTLDGGEGIDTASYADSQGGVKVQLDTGKGYGGSYTGNAAGDTLKSIENLTGSAYQDFLKGDGKANVLRGNAGNDTIVGEGGVDTLRGDDGKDDLIGGAGGDWLYGGADKDSFRYDNLSDTGLDLVSADVIADFSKADGDIIRVYADMDTETDGHQYVTFIGTGDYTGAGQARVVFANGDTFIAFNTDSNPDNEAAIRILGTHDIDASCFSMFL
jgi:Ca2+-binding RTX toxin-like protein